MTVITEYHLRSLFRENPFTTFEVEEGQLMTPSATQFLQERRVKIERTKKETVPAASRVEKVADDVMAAVTDSSENVRNRPRYVSAADGGRFDAKPEHMTQLRGNRLVAKDHPRIIFRGKLDCFQSSVLLVQANAYELGKNELVSDLDDVLNRIREIMKADVLEAPLDDSLILGLTPDALRQLSHNPKKYFGIDHILPSYSMGKIILELNQLRSLVREVEVAAVKAFRKEFDIERTDLIEALNRMSSALYVMMVKEKSGKNVELKPGLDT